VKRGQVLARMDAATYELRVAHARADLEGARERLAAVQGQQPKASRAELRRALLAVKERESLLGQAQADLERTAILAPVDGIVILRNVDAGQTVAAEPQAPVLFTIAEDLRHMQIEAAMDAADARRLRVGLEATFSVDAFPRRVFAGEILQVRKSPQAGSAAARYTAVISAPNPDLALLPGMAADVRLVLHRRESVLKVPNAALRFRMPGEKPGLRGATVWVLDEGEARPVEVRPGITDGAFTEIADGRLAEGASVILESM
jgi:HlyD family secretion protein